MIAYTCNQVANSHQPQETKAANAPPKTIDALVHSSQCILFKCTTIFPFDLFPDLLSIDENKVNILNRGFFGIEDIHSIPIEDISDVEVAETPFSATLEITDSSNPRFPTYAYITPLSISNAQKARRIIQGLMIAKRQGIDLSDSTSIEQLCTQLEILGRAEGETFP